MDKLLEKIVLDKLDDITALSPGERIDVRANQEMSSSMAENKLLSGLSAGAPVAPARMEMLQRVMEGSAQHGGLFPPAWISGRRWYLAAVLCLAVTVFCAGMGVWLVPGRIAAHSDGFMLAYDMGPAPELPVKSSGSEVSSAGFMAPTLCDSRDAQVRQKLAELGRKRKLLAALRGELPNNVLTISEKVEKNRRVLCVGLAQADEKLLMQIKRSLGKVPGMPEPKVSDATWFSAGKVDPNKEALVLQLGNRTLNFDPGFSELQVQQALNDWLADNRPGFRGEVAFVDNGGRTDIQLHLVPLDPAEAGLPHLAGPNGEMADAASERNSQFSLRSNDTAIPAYGVGQH
jgi:hypothetical protein